MLSVAQPSSMRMGPILINETLHNVLYHDY